MKSTRRRKETTRSSQENKKNPGRFVPGRSPRSASNNSSFPEDETRRLVDALGDIGETMRLLHRCQATRFPIEVVRKAIGDLCDALDTFGVASTYAYLRHRLRERDLERALVAHNQGKKEEPRPVKEIFRGGKVAP